MTNITVKSFKPTGFYSKTFSLDEREYEKFGDLAMEAMTRAVEGVVKECREKSGSSSTTSRSFIKHFFISFGPLMWAFEGKNESDPEAHYTTLTELALRNAGYSNLSSLVNKCTDRLNKDLEEHQDNLDIEELDFEDEDGELF